MNSGSVWQWLTSPQSSQTRADLAVLHAIESGEGEWLGEPVSCSRSQIQRLMEEGRVLADQIPLQPRNKLSAGTRVKIHFPTPKPTTLVAEDQPLDILFQDSHLVVVNKAPGITVHPSDTQTEGTLVHALLHHIHDLSGIGGEMRPGIVHRIDKNTSGALVITKTDVAHRALAEVFARHEIERAYWAICYGSPATAAGRIESLIGRSPTDRKKMSMTVKEGRSAVTHYRRLKEYGSGKAKPFASLIEARLETGRTHQVRVHLTGLGHSLLGDPTYGTPSDRQPKWQALPSEVREAVRRLPGQALHARTLGFKHPVTGELLRFEATPPPEFQALLDAITEY